MNLFQLFMALPRDLQWEILSVFVGSHRVRNGKLIKRLVFDERHQMIKDLPRIQRSYIGLYIRNFDAKTDVQLWSGSQLMFCENATTGKMEYLFRKRKIRTHSREEKSYEHKFTQINDSVTLSPFEKHSYNKNGASSRI